MHANLSRAATEGRSFGCCCGCGSGGAKEWADQLLSRVFVDSGGHAAVCGDVVFDTRYRGRLAETSDFGTLYADREPEESFCASDIAVLGRTAGWWLRGVGVADGELPLRGGSTADAGWRRRGRWASAEDGGDGEESMGGTGVEGVLCGAGDRVFQGGADGGRELLRLRKGEGGFRCLRTFFATFGETGVWNTLPNMACEGVLGTAKHGGADILAVYNIRQ